MMFACVDRATVAFGKVKKVPKTKWSKYLTKLKKKYINNFMQCLVSLRYANLKGAGNAWHCSPSNQRAACHTEK